jgi:hypothetical protein
MEGRIVEAKVERKKYETFKYEEALEKFLKFIVSRCLFS